jgi:hypothetical protein
VQQERIGVPAELGDDERDLVDHQPADEMNVTAEPIQLGHDDRRLALLGLLERCGQLRPAIECIGPLARFDFDERVGELKALGAGEAGDGRHLGLEPET